MSIKYSLRTFIIFQFVSCAFLETIPIRNVSDPVNVLANVFPPFTYFDSTRGFYDGIDIKILKTIAERLNLRLTFTKMNDFNLIPVVNLE